MLSCRQFTDRLSAQIEGELSLADRLGMGLHRLICVDCRRFASQMKLLVASLADRPPVEAPTAVDEAFADRVMTALDTQSERSDRPD